MTLDFDKINDKRVGYKTIRRGKGWSCISRINTFKDFIPPYSEKTTSYLEVYRNLEAHLAIEIEAEDYFLNGRRHVPLLDLAKRARKRESILNSLILIQQHYLK